MKFIQLKSLWCLSLILVGSSSFAYFQRATPTPTPIPNPVPSLNRILWVWLENTPHSQLSIQRFSKSLWLNYPSVRFTSYLPVSPITQANVIAMIAGTDLGVTDNNLTRILSPTLLDMLESKNISWKVYSEDFPGSCYLGTGIGNYRRYRVPFLSIAQVQSDRYRCMKILSFASYVDDIKTGSLPQFSILIPNLLNSGATGTILDADNALRTILNPVVSDPDLMANTTIIISSTNNQNVAKPEMFMMMLGNGIKDYALSVSTRYHHYNLLRTLEEGLHLGNLNQQDVKSDTMVGFWK